MLLLRRGIEIIGGAYPRPDQVSRKLMSRSESASLANVRLLWLQADDAPLAINKVSHGAKPENGNGSIWPGRHSSVRRRRNSGIPASDLMQKRLPRYGVMLASNRGDTGTFLLAQPTAQPGGQLPASSTHPL